MSYRRILLLLSLAVGRLSLPLFGYPISHPKRKVVLRCRYPFPKKLLSLLNRWLTSSAFGGSATSCRLVSLDRWYSAGSYSSSSPSSPSFRYPYPSKRSIMQNRINIIAVIGFIVDSPSLNFIAAYRLFSSNLDHYLVAILPC